MKRKLLIILVSLSLLPTIALADDASQLVDLISKYYRSLLLPIGAVLAGIMLMYAGIIYSSSGGDASKIQKAKEIVVSTISGLVLLIFAAFIVGMIAS